MKIAVLTPEEVRERCDQYTFVLAYEISQLYFGRTNALKGQLHWEELTEARFFDQKGEIHLCDDGDGQKAYEITDTQEPQETVHEETYTLTGKFRAAGKGIVVKEYLDFDEDGQVQVCCKRLEDVI